MTTIYWVACVNWTVRVRKINEKGSMVSKREKKKKYKLERAIEEKNEKYAY